MLTLALVACWWLTVLSAAMGWELPPAGLSPAAWQAITDYLERDLSIEQPTAASAQSDVVYESAKLLASDGTLGKAFGHSISVSGDTVVVGAFSDDEQGESSGSAYVFEKPAGGWSGTLTEAAKLLASDGATWDYFGWSVSVSGDTVVVGAVLDDDLGKDSGSAYVFEKPAGGWSGTLTENAKLLASDGALDDEFGASVSVSGDIVVVGADYGDDQGSAYIFQRPAGGWSGTLTETAKLLASDGASGELFGWSVSISGDTVVVGAPYDGDQGNDSGSAYVFERPAGGWSGTLSEAAKLLASDGARSDFFGFSVSISGETVVVGAWWDDTEGSAYVFGKPSGGWYGTLNEDAKLLASDSAYERMFGYSAAVSADTVVVGAPFENQRGRGSAYLFEKPAGGWSGTLTETAKLLASDGASGELFGWSVSISAETVGAGTYYSAYVFAPPDSDGDGVPDELDVCPDTVIPEGVPTRRLGRNRFALVDDDGVFDTNRPPGRGPEVGFTIEETGGCSCEQIIDALGLGKGHEKYGCSLGAMEAWVELVNP